MTRQEFIEGVNSFSDLISFCQDESLYNCDDVCDEYYLNEIILDLVRQMQDWEEIKRLVSDIPIGCMYYREDGCGGWEDAECYFEEYKNDVLREMDNTESWDEEDVDNDDEGPEYMMESITLEDPEGDIEVRSFMTVLGKVS